MPEGKNLFANWIGQQLGKHESALDELKRIGYSTPTFAERAWALLADVARRVADDNRFVGRSLLVNVLPRSAIKAGQTEHFFIAGGPSPDHPTFLYVPHDGDESVTYGPTTVCGGGMSANFVARDLS